MAGYIAALFGAEYQRAHCLADCDRASPLILDLDGDGVEADGSAFFDHAGDGSAELTRWAGADDGVLVWDRNGDGKINDGSELFGDSTVLSNGREAANGFAALSELDSNGDGAVDAADANWGDLRILRWSDANANGFVDEGEEYLETLSSQSVSKLNLSYRRSSHVDESGNEHRQVGSYEKADGTTATMTDVWFLTSPGMARNDTSQVPEHSEEIEALPEIQGFGRLHSLRDAMALDEAGLLSAPFYGSDRSEARSLSALVAAFKDETDAAEREELAEKILLRWAGAEDVSSSDYRSGGYMAYTTAERFAVVEAFRGDQLWEGRTYRHPSYSTAQKIDGLYKGHYEMVHGLLMLQTHLSDLMASLSVTVPEEVESVEEISWDFSGAVALVDAGENARRSEFLRAIAGTFGGQVDADMERTASSFLYEYRYYVEALDDIVHAGVRLRRNDFEGGNVGEKDANGVDVFETADGMADRLRGKGGSDSYHLQLGTGLDVIDESWGNRGNLSEDEDVIRVAPGVGTDRVQLSRSRDDLAVSLRTADGTISDSFRVLGHYAGESSRIEKVVFEDGTVWGEQEFRSVQLSSGRGSSGDDTYDGSLDGLDGLLQGGQGSDTYLFGLGSGHDTVNERAYGGLADEGVDKVRLKDDVMPSSVKLSRTGYDLVISLVDAEGAVTDTLTIENQYLSGREGIEQITFADGTEWTEQDIWLVRLPTGPGSFRDDVYDGSLDGADGLLQGGRGSDMYWFGPGSGHDTVDERAYGGLTDGGVDTVRLEKGVVLGSLKFSRTERDLVISLVDAEGMVTDTLTIRGQYETKDGGIELVMFADGTEWEDFDSVTFISGGRGSDGADIYDGGSGGTSEVMQGGWGGDVYRFGRGSGEDVVDEAAYGYNKGSGDGGSDTVRLEAGLTSADVKLTRTKYDLVISVLDAAEKATDTLTVRDYYVSDRARIERVELSTGALLWDADDFAGVSWEAPSYVTAMAELVGGSGNDFLYGGGDMNDVFDGDAGGNDHLYGRGGDDVYLLGSGTGADTIYEYSQNEEGDAGDVIRLKTGIAPGSVRLRRSNDGNDLSVELLDAEGSVTDSLRVPYYYTKDNAKVERVEFSDGTVWGANEFMSAEIVGGSGNDLLYGESDLNDVFDGDAGGTDHLYGYGGDDVYLLGAGTGADTIYEYSQNEEGDAGDVIRLKGSIAPSLVRLWRSNDGDDLYVELLDAEGLVTDSLRVVDHYTKDNAKVERVEFSDGTVWDAHEFMSAEIVGGSGNDFLYGESGLNDVFDADAGGNDHLYGRGGDDVYLLGAGTGADTIYEYSQNGEGDAEDVIRLKAGIAPGSVRLWRSDDGDDLYVELLDAEGLVTDSLRVVDHYTKDNAKVERVEFSDGTVWDAHEFMSAEIVGGSGNDFLYGGDDMNDVFDADAGGNDHLYGRGGDDMYLFGAGTGADTIYEYSQNEQGDAGDVIRLKGSIAPGAVRLRRSDDGNDLYVELLGAPGVVTNSLRVVDHYTKENAKVERVEFSDGMVWGANEFMSAEIVGGSGNDFLYGESNLNDVFDGDAGGNDHLYGYGGDDVYLLGAGTGADTIYEYSQNEEGDAGDVIRLKAGIVPGSVRLWRSNDGDDLSVELLDAEGLVTDSLRVVDYYTKENAKVERVEFVDGTVWDAHEFMSTEIVGGSGNDFLHGESDLNDIFDGDAGGNDHLYGYGGDDVYLLGAGTGRDTIYEYSQNEEGDEGDVIRLKAGIAPGSVRLWRSNDGDDLSVELLDAEGLVTDSLRVPYYYTRDNAKVESVEFSDGTVWGVDEFMSAELVGGSRADFLHGKSDMNDIFDGDAGGNDHLYGYGGDDVYLLGAGTGRDTIYEYSQNEEGDEGDVIRLKAGIAPGSVRLWRSNDGDDLSVELLDAEGLVTDSLRVPYYYTRDNAKVESVEFSDGTVWGADEFMSAELVGGSHSDFLYGESDLNDIFDGDAGGNDHLYGYGGDDVYLLGAGTGADTIYEYSQNEEGDAGDAIRVKEGIALSAIQLSRSGADLLVELVNADGVSADSLRVSRHYSDGSGEVERIEASGRVLLSSDYGRLMDALSAFTAGTSDFATKDALLTHYWREEDSLGDSGAG